MIERRKLDDISKSFAENGPDTTAGYGDPVRQRRMSQIAPTLYRVDAADERRSGGREPGIWQVTHHQMHQGKNAAGQRGYGQQLNDARQRETNRQGNEQLDVPAANPSPGVDDRQQQQQDRSGDQRLGNLHRAGQLTSDPEERQRQTNLISDQSCRDIGCCNIQQQQDFQKRDYGNNPTHQMHASEKEVVDPDAP